jgi:NAD(P)-dependent dehydrogenase (short-subunit alcohol dehydrogenase family)
VNTGDVALVGGAQGALGRAIVDGFLARGDRVVGVSRRESSRGEEALTTEVADLSDPDEVEALWRRLEERGDRPRWVVNAVGGYRPGTVADSEPDDVKLVHELNLATAWWSCRAAAQRLGPGSAILNVSSRAAVIGSGRAAAYAVAKAGVVRLTEVLAAELAERRVRVNAVLPSRIDTPVNRASLPPEQMRSAVPPTKIAAVVSFLCSDAASAVTGAVLPVYGWA